MFDGRWRTGVDRGTKPVGEALRRSGVTPNQLTVFGMAMSVGAAFAIGSGHLLWAVASLLACGLPDLFDGPLAKATGRTSVQGAFLDSVADRISDALLFGGLAWYLTSRHSPHTALLALAILAATMLVSYERSKAESLGLSAKGGIMERAERFIALGLSFLFSSVMVPILWAMLGLTLVTAVGRFVQVWRQAPGPDVAPRRRPSTISSWRERHAGTGPSRWRQRQHEHLATRVGRMARAERPRRPVSRLESIRSRRGVGAASGDSSARSPAFRTVRRDLRRARHDGPTDS